MNSFAAHAGYAGRYGKERAGRGEEPFDETILYGLQFRARAVVR
jgi:hypothetical protein